ncbi:MAG: hypothetical protein KatS3mg055_2271 [Chloroflexus sp.]|nr:MAG: hypothetical protein KatS3mg055_2271 [Chloroflexus sp.]
MWRNSPTRLCEDFSRDKPNVVRLVRVNIPVHCSATYSEDCDNSNLANAALQTKHVLVACVDFGLSRC